MVSTTMSSSRSVSNRLLPDSRRSCRLGPTPMPAPWLVTVFTASFPAARLTPSMTLMAKHNALLLMRLTPLMQTLTATATTPFWNYVKSTNHQARNREVA